MMRSTKPSDPKYSVTDGSPAMAKGAGRDRARRRSAHVAGLMERAGQTRKAKNEVPRDLVRGGAMVNRTPDLILIRDAL